MTNGTNPNAPVLELEGITKRFPGVLANDSVDLVLRRGEILALLGENGAGKSTLMNIVYGLYHADEGTIKLKGQPIRFASPREAISSGIGMVHQHFQLIPVMTVAENITLGEEAVMRTADSDKPAPIGEGRASGTIRVIWGWLWRALLPVLAVLIGLLVGQVMLLLMFVLSTYLVNEARFRTFQFERLPLAQKGVQAFGAYYVDHPLATQLLVWLPLVLACLAGAAITVLGYRHARRTWRGRQDVAISPLDGIIDSVIDFVSTVLLVRNQRRTSNKVRDISKQYGLEVDPDALVENLPVGLQQRVEIVKALYRKADILILDEPTAVLTPQEGQELFKIMRQLAAQGVSIIFISHKLKEALQISDRIMVMRGGKVVGSTTPAESSEASLAAMMVGRSVMLRVAKDAAHPGEVVLKAKGLRAIDDRKANALNGVSFEVRAGEVLGIAGVQGNGQTELVEVLTGLRPLAGGHFAIAGNDFAHVTPRSVTKAGSAHIPEDRQRYGMVSAYSVADNLVLNDYDEAPFSTAPSMRQLPFVLLLFTAVFGVVFGAFSLLWSSALWPVIASALSLANPDLDPRANPGPFLISVLLIVAATLVFGVIAYIIAARVTRYAPVGRNASGGLTFNRPAVNNYAVKLVKEFDIRTPTVELNAGNLSGGNQQKMVVAREFSRKPRLLIASQPTRGIDVGSIEFIHQRIVKQRDEGAAVLLVSAELDEIMALSDRIAVMYQGQIIETLPAESATREQLGLLMAGIKPEAALVTDAP